MKHPVLNPNWPDDVVKIYNHDMREMWDRTIQPNVYNEYQKQLKMYSSLVPNQNSKVLDVGCAQATLGLFLAELGHHVTALDIRQDFLDYAESRWTHGDIEFVQGNIFDVDLKGPFDVIFANQVIEHLVYPKEFVVHLSSMLRKGGRLIATTPNGTYLQNSLPSYRELGNPDDWKHKQFTADGDDHFFAYLKEELIEIFESAGLKNIDCSFYSSPVISGHFKLRYVHRFLPSSLLDALDRIMLKHSFNGKLAYQLIASGMRLE